MKRVVIYQIALLIWVAAFAMVCFSQEWRKLVPQSSTCEDVKHALGVESCTFPVSNYKMRDFSASVTFSKATRSPKVLRVMIAFNNWIDLKSFESDLSGYVILPEGDLENSRMYRNDEKGITFAAQELSNGQKYVTSVTLFPRKKKR